MVDRIHDLKVNLGIYYRTNTSSPINLFLLTHPSVIKPNLTRGIKGKEKKANKTLWIVILNFVTPSTTAQELINATIILQKNLWMNVRCEILCHSSKILFVYLYLPPK